MSVRPFVYPSACPSAVHPSARPIARFVRGLCMCASARERTQARTHAPTHLATHPCIHAKHCSVQLQIATDNGGDDDDVVAFGQTNAHRQGQTERTNTLALSRSGTVSDLLNYFHVQTSRMRVRRATEQQDRTNQGLARSQSFTPKLTGSSCISRGILDRQKQKKMLKSHRAGLGCPL